MRRMLRRHGGPVALLLVATLSAAPPVHSADPVRVHGWASAYDHTAGYEGRPTVALPSSLGGRYTGRVYAVVRVCAERCALLPAVDWCYCHVMPSSHPDRVVDLSYAAWALVTSARYGLVPVTVEVRLHPGAGLPDTAMEGPE